MHLKYLKKRWSIVSKNNGKSDNGEKYNREINNIVHYLKNDKNEIEMGMETPSSDQLPCSIFHRLFIHNHISILPLPVHFIIFYSLYGNADVNFFRRSSENNYILN